MNRPGNWTSVITVFAALFVASTAVAQPPAPIEVAPQQLQQTQVDGNTVVAKASLIMAYDLYQQYKAVGVELDVEAMIQGFRLAAAGQKLPISDEESDVVVESFNKAIDARKMEMEAIEIRENQIKCKEFLEKNSQVEGVQVLPSGVQYRVIQQGTGASPEVTDFVLVHYTGKLVDGTQFESSVGKEPAKFPVSGVVRGMTECLLKMKVGEKCQMAIPAELAWGRNGPPGIGPDQAVVFDVELIAIEK